MKTRVKVGISSCLLGNRVRYDGGHKLDYPLKETLGRVVEWVPVCPEVGCGLAIPREEMRLTGAPGNPRLVTRRTGIDHTDRMLSWTTKKLDGLEKETLCGFVLKSRSPSCGMRKIKVYTSFGSPAGQGPGIFARRLMSRFPSLPVEDNDRFQDRSIRENFIERVFLFKAWKDLGAKEALSLGRLVSFHSDHKLEIMAHSPNHLRLLGKMVAEGQAFRPADLHDRYLNILMDGLKLKATIKKNVNVLHHIMGHFKKELSGDEKRELLEAIALYHQGLAPLTAPMALINKYVLKYNRSYLKRQTYLSFHPIEP